MASMEKKPKSQQFLAWLKTISVEPVMLLDGLAFANMVVLVENLQMDKVCHVNLNNSLEVCNNLSEHKEVREEMTKEVSVFAMYNSIIMSIIPLFFILFMGAWSDKYGRKVPLLLSTVGHFLYALGYLVVSMVDAWPVEYLLAVALLDTLGGGAVAFLTAANSYISDVTSEEVRTARLGFANSIWFLGGPIGTFMGTYIYRAGGYTATFATSIVMYAFAIVYITFLVPESHGPFANVKKLEKILPPKQSIRLRESIYWVYGLEKKKKELVRSESAMDRVKKISVAQMIKDFFDPRRFLDSIKCTLKQREGNVRLFILMLIFCNLLRKLGRGAYMYLFTRHVLHWQADDYGIWVTYKNLLATMGSLVAVPVLSAGLKVSDNILAMVGALSSVFDYILYGMVTEDTYFFMWLAPLAALLVNSCAIAIRAMLSKYVQADEIGKVSAVLGALDGLMPMVSFSLYTAVYHSTVEDFPGAQFFFGACSNVLMALVFIAVMMIDTTDDYNVETATVPEADPNAPVKERSLVMHKDSNWLYDEGEETDKRQIRLATILLSSLNFSIEVPTMMSLLAKPLETIEEEPEKEEEEEKKTTQEQQQANGGFDNLAYSKEDV